MMQVQHARPFTCYAASLYSFVVYLKTLSRIQSTCSYVAIWARSGDIRYPRSERVTKDSPKFIPLSRMKFVKVFEPPWTRSLVL
jgi:hypothetical protein